ncbi:hypothetical protein RintRC_6646 [Richelia intracellularis]|nr:hypothetical protein RintRC_6896 [Richelia intracellularis]CDN16655.1 hypothetical protein RintRC_6646 [Richelia intracellularis]
MKSSPDSAMPEIPVFGSFIPQICNPLLPKTINRFSQIQVTNFIMQGKRI